MDTEHEKHLERILQNRRSRGVLQQPQASQPAFAAVPQQFQPPTSPPVVQTKYLPASQQVVQPTSQFVPSLVQGPLRANSTMEAAQPRATGVGQRAPSAGSTAAVMQRGPSPSRQMDVDSLFRKGTFENFRRNPILVSTNIRPYNNSPVRSRVAPSRHEGSSPRSVRRQSQQQWEGAEQAAATEGPTQQWDDTASSDTLLQQLAVTPSLNAVAAASFARKNPFRNQTFEDFCEAPNNDNVGHPVLPVQQTSGPATQPRFAPGREESQPSSPPLFDPQQSLLVLQQGDWFLKWTRIESAHRRYVWLDLSRGVISWAKSRDSSFFLQKSVKLEDIMDLQPVCVVDETSARTFYKIVVVSLDRILKIGTELRDKFDVWFDTLQRLCEAQRTYTHTFMGRHAASNALSNRSDYQRTTAAASSSD